MGPPRNTDRRTRAAIAIGSNLGDREAAVQRAFGSLGALGPVERGPVIETDPIGPPGQGAYLNSAAVVETTLGPREVLETLLAIERSTGRERARSQRWGPRELDLDLVLFGDAVIDEPGLEVPHPRMHERRFVLEPLSAIWPDAMHPVLGVTVGELLTLIGDAKRIGALGERR